MKNGRWGRPTAVWQLPCPYSTSGDHTVRLAKQGRLHFKCEVPVPVLADVREAGKMSLEGCSGVLRAWRSIRPGSGADHFLINNAIGGLMGVRDARTYRFDVHNSRRRVVCNTCLGCGFLRGGKCWGCDGDGWNPNTQIRSSRVRRHKETP